MKNFFVKNRRKIICFVLIFSILFGVLAHSYNKAMAAWSSYAVELVSGRDFVTALEVCEMLVALAGGATLAEVKETWKPQNSMQENFDTWYHECLEKAQERYPESLFPSFGSETYDRFISKIADGYAGIGRNKSEMSLFKESLIQYEWETDLMDNILTPSYVFGQLRSMVDELANPHNDDQSALERVQQDLENGMTLTADKLQYIVTSGLFNSLWNRFFKTRANNLRIAMNNTLLCNSDSVDFTAMGFMSPYYDFQEKLISNELCYIKNCGFHIVWNDGSLIGRAICGGSFTWKRFSTREEAVNAYNLSYSYPCVFTGTDNNLHYNIYSNVPLSCSSVGESYGFYNQVSMQIIRNNSTTATSSYNFGYKDLSEGLSIYNGSNSFSKQVQDALLSYQIRQDITVSTNRLITLGTYSDYLKFCEFIDSGNFTLKEVLELYRDHWKYDYTTTYPDLNKTISDAIQNGIAAAYSNAKGLVDIDSIADAISERIGATDIPVEEGSDRIITPTYELTGGAVANEKDLSISDVITGRITDVQEKNEAEEESQVITPPIDPDLSEEAEKRKAIAQQVTGELDSVDPSKLRIKSLEATHAFPFCIPYDIVKCIKQFNAEKSTPSWSVPFYVRSMKFKENVTIDFSIYDNLALLVRSLLLIIFIVGLAVLSRYIIGG